MRIDPKPADLNTIVEELADFLMPQAQAQRVRMRVDLAPGPLRAALDIPQVKQAALNLILNAIQAMADSTSTPKELILRTAKRLDQDRRPVVSLHVIDTGPGIPADSVDRIFQPYFTTKSGGTGLGLPTARRLIEGHEGRLEVRTEPGRGSEFIASFPAL
jgi:signal transduction histidine kinase